MKKKKENEEMDLSEITWDNIKENISLLEKFSNLKVDDRIIALGKFLELTPNEANNCIKEKESKYDSNTYEYGEKEYTVLTDFEAERRFIEDIESYIDDVVMYEIPKHYHAYFDDEKFINDCMIDGRGHTISRYDGAENEQSGFEDDYFIYRMN